MKTKILGLLAAGLLAGPMAANAISWNWTYSGGGTIGGSGTFTTNNLTGDYFLVTAISGTAEGQSITSLLAVDTFLFNDNKLFDGTPQLSFYGISFAAGPTFFNLFDSYSSATGSNQYLAIGEFTRYPGISFAATRASVPEPGTLALLGLGLAGLGLSRRRKAA